MAQGIALKMFVYKLTLYKITMKVKDKEVKQFSNLSNLFTIHVFSYQVNFTNFLIQILEIKYKIRDQCRL